MNCSAFHDSRQRCGIAYRVKHTQVGFAPDSNSMLDRLEANYYDIQTLVLTEDESKRRQSDVQSGVLSRISLSFESGQQPSFLGPFDKFPLTLITVVIV